MVTYNGREVTIVKNAHPGEEHPERLIVNVKGEGNQVVNKTDLVFSKEERDAELKQEAEALDAQKAEYAKKDKAEAKASKAM